MSAALNLPHRRWRSCRAALAALASASTLLIAGPQLAMAAAPAAQSGETTPAFPDVARQQALDHLGVALRLQIEEQYVAAELAFQRAMAADARLAALQQAFGDHSLAAGRPQQAVAAYGAITRLDPYSPRGYALLGAAQLTLGQPTGIDQLHKALEMDALAADARLPLAELARSAGDIERMRSLLAPISKEDQALPAVQLARAEAALLAGDEDAAAATLKSLLERNPDDPALQLAAGELWLAHGRCPRALPALQREAATRPRAESLRSYGWSLLLCGRAPVRAAGAFSAALQQDRGDDGAKVGLAWSLLALEQQGEPLQQAGQWADEILRRDQAHPAALLVRAEVHRRSGEREAAASLLQRIPPQHPAADEAALMRARLALDEEDPYAAVRILRELSERRPDMLHARAVLALAFLKAGRSKDARATIQALRTVLPAGHPLLAWADRLTTRTRSAR